MMDDDWVIDVVVGVLQYDDVMNMEVGVVVGY